MEDENEEKRDDHERLCQKGIRHMKCGLQRLPGNILYTVNRDLAVRLFGGWREMVLVKEKGQ